MVANPNAYSKYSEQSVMTASRGELTLMLYEGAVKFCNQAIVALENKDAVTAHLLIDKVERIIEELETTLNFNYDISKSFFSLYDYMYRRSLEAQRKRDPEIIKEVCNLFKDFRDTWKEAIKIARSQGMNV